MQTESPKTTANEFLLAKFEALLAECDLIDNYGILDNMEALLLDKGRKLLQETFEQKLQERVKQVETTQDAKQCSHCKKKTQYHSKKTKDITTVHGHVTLERCYRYCSHCKAYSFPIEVTLGLTTLYTTALTRLATRCCGFWSYQHAADNLAELAGIRLSDTTIGKIAHETAGKIADKMDDNPAFRHAFQQAKGNSEFYMDGTFVPILNTDGTRDWREMKVAAFVKRLLGASATPEEWASRLLPKPSAVYAFASIASKEDFQEYCQQERRRLGVGNVSSALGDGAKWIWNIIRELFGKTDECLDIYHALEHIASCGKALYGEGETFLSWLDSMRLVLLSEGFAGIDRELQSLAGELKGKSKKVKAQRVLVSSLREYLLGNAQRLNYAERLLSGLPIGSGLIEGACKNLVGRRLKQTGACWRLERANRMALVCSLLYADQWQLCWKNSN
jgi:hypothetical protein